MDHSLQITQRKQYLQPGQEFSYYKVYQILGQGGMGVV